MAETGRRPHASPRLLLLLLVVACAARVYVELTYADLDQDKARQLVMAESFAQGHGFSLCTADPDDLSRARYERFNQWPVGYPLLIAELAPLVDGPFAAAHFLDALGVVVLVCSLHMLLGLLGAGTRGRAWFLAFTAVSFAPYYELYSTDLLAVSCFVLAATLTLRRLGSTRSGLGIDVLVGVALFGAAFVRYAYYPLSPVVPACAVVAGLWIGDRALVRTGVVSGAIFAALLAGLIAYHVDHFGAATRAIGGGGLHPANLLHVDPFPLNAVLYVDVLADNLHVALPSLDGVARAVALALSALILVAVLRPCGGVVRAAWKRRPAPLMPFWLLVGVTIIANVGLIGWISLTNKAQTDWTEFYTHVQEARFYAPSMFLIQVSLVLLLLRDGPAGSAWRRAGRAGLAAAMLFAVAYAGYRAFKVHALDTPTIYGDKRDTVARVVSKIEELTGDDMSGVVFADADNPVRACAVAVLTDALAVLDCDELLNGRLATSRSVDLFVLGAAAPSEAERAFAERTGAQSVLAIGASTLYRVRVQP